jgi:rod shape-determining protein MreC
MTLSRRAREWVIVAVLLALPLLFLRANVKAPSDLNFFDRLLLRISAPIEAALSWCARGIGRGWSRYVYLVHVTQDNEGLRAENARLRAELDAAKQEAARATQLEELLAQRARVPVETVPARVVASETSAFFRVMRLRLQADGAEVKPGMPVIAAAGVVGRVQRVYGPYSDVLLASDPKSGIDVVVPRTGGRGVVKGIAGDNRYRTRIEYLLRNDEVAEGDRVFTSGLGAFPRDILVGKIVKVFKRDYGLYQEAELEPAVDFSKLDRVLIVRVTPAEVTAEPGAAPQKSEPGAGSSSGAAKAQAHP